LPEFRDTFLRWFLPQVGRALKEIATAGHGRVIIEIADGKVRRLEVSRSYLIREPQPTKEDARV
jgi:hypothetical protein